MKELARRVEADPSFLSRVERGLVAAPAELVRRVASELGVEAEPLLVLAGHLPEDVRLLLAEHPQEVLDVLRAAFRRREARAELGQ
jgi:transcriptional regulator with XRE-family HTH domain